MVEQLADEHLEVRARPAATTTSAPPVLVPHGPRLGRSGCRPSAAPLTLAPVLVLALDTATPTLVAGAGALVAATAAPRCSPSAPSRRAPGTPSC